MAKLIGTNPNQVPSNADLGSAAFSDAKEFLSARGANLSAIKARIDKEVSTIVDVFIYDTTLDSDGGAWRKRTQHTSWYNEELGTNTRGYRAEFPQVAVIVVESAYITIFDGDDPDLPMWMAFKDASYASQLWENSPSKVYALNGKLACANAPYDLNVVDFIADNAVSYSDSPTISGTHKFPISGRSPTSGSYSSPADIWEFGTVNNIINRYCYDVAMKVLTGAPIDPDTGLPIPHIAVATGGGTSIIHPNGRIYDITDAGNNYNGAYTVEFDKACDTNNTSQDMLWIGASTWIGQGGRATYKEPILATDSTINISSHRYFTQHSNPGFQTFDGYPNAHKLTATKDGVAMFQDGTTNPLYLLSEKTDEYTFREKGLLALINNEYNTGWMLGHGDINNGTILSIMSDTKPGNIYGVDKAPTSYNPVNSYGVTFSSGTLSLTPADASDYGASNSVSGLIPNGLYVLSYDVTTATDSSHGLKTTGANTIDDRNIGGVGSYTRVIRANSSGEITEILFGRGDVGSTTGSVTNVFQNIVLRHAVADRTVEGYEIKDDAFGSHGGQINGQLRKTKVAPGADLVSYSGFVGPENGGSYIRVPDAKPDGTDQGRFDFGTGDLYMMLWVRRHNTATNEVLFQKGDTTTGGNGAVISLQATSGYWYAYTTGGAGGPSGTNNYLQTSWTHDTLWHHICATRRNGELFFYVDGVLENQGTRDWNVNNTGDLIVGGYQGGGTSFAVSSEMALLRIGGSALTNDQVRKIYQDEKELFTPNAKAIIYGSSQGINATAYDEQNDLLHVGTGQGISTFSKLRRVDESDDAIGSALSAVNGMVAGD